jgi:hypothetical protein
MTDTTVIDNYILTSVREHCGSWVTAEALEVALEPAEKAVKDAKSSGHDLPIEFALVESVKALWAAAHQGHKQNVDFNAYVREKLAVKDSLLSKLLGRKSKVAEQVADLKQYEQEINESRAGLKASEAKVVEIQNSIATTEAELVANSQEAVENSINRAAETWHLRHRSPHHESIVASAVSHAVEQDVVDRILNARLIILRDKLEAEKARVEAFTKQLRQLEKQN